MIGKVYILQSLNTDKVYIGSTFQTLEERFWHHKAMSNETSSYLVIDKGDATIELLEEIKVIDEPELRFYEQQYLELYRDVAVNDRGAFGINEERKRIGKKEYYEKNKYKIECPCGSVIVNLNMHNHIKTQKHKNYLYQDKE
jgi:hypothetical protein